MKTAAEDGGAVETDILVIGAGFSGMIMAIEARRRGFGDVVILEKADDFGGTWRENTYPGVACDIPAHLYSIASHPNAGWTRAYASGAEIWDYLRDVARRERLYDRVRFGRTFSSAEWDAALRRWRVETAEGRRFCARVLVSGMGALHVPKPPDIPGLAGFAGPAFHSAEWNHRVNLAGKRVAVVGTGASAIQFVPEIARIAGHVDVYQRTPPWVMPRLDGGIPPWMRRAYAVVPGLRRLRRFAIHRFQEVQHRIFRGNPRAVRLAEAIALRHMARAIPDPALRQRLTPDYRIGCKRILLSNAWYPALARQNVSVVTGPIREVRPEGLIVGDGEFRPADALIFGTGFRVTETLGDLAIEGLDGLRLGAHWEAGASAFLGAATSGFPNLFFLLGPNTGLGHNSVVLMIEAQVAHVVRVLDEMRAKQIEAVEVRPEVETRYADEMARRLSSTVWQAGGCVSWYQDAEGRNPVLWPGGVDEFRRRAGRASLADYRPV